MPTDEDYSERDQREILYTAIQASIAERPDLEGSVLLGFSIIAEWQSPDGHKWLTKISGDAFGELPPWRERMFGQELSQWELFSPPVNITFEEEDDEYA